MQETLAITITSLRETSELVVAIRSRSISWLIDESFSIYVSLDGT